MWGFHHTQISESSDTVSLELVQLRINVSLAQRSCTTGRIGLGRVWVLVRSSFECNDSSALAEQINILQYLVVPFCDSQGKYQYLDILVISNTGQYIPAEKWEIVLLSQ